MIAHAPPVVGFKVPYGHYVRLLPIATGVLLVGGLIVWLGIAKVLRWRADH